MSDVINLPTPGVVLDLDLETRPEKDVKPPFIVKVGGKAITFKDPGEIDWRVLATVDTPADLIRVSLAGEDREHLTSQVLEAWKFNRLMDSYYQHYDMEERIEEAKRRAKIGI